MSVFKKKNKDAGDNPSGPSEGFADLETGEKETNNLLERLQQGIKQTQEQQQKQKPKEPDRGCGCW